MIGARVLVLTDWYLPGFKAGGPIRSVANMVTALAREFEFSILTSDRDMGDPARYPGIEAGRWQLRDRHRVLYLPRGRLDTYPSMLRVLREVSPDILHVNGLFSPLFSILPLAARRLGRGHGRCLIAPRGMLGAGALQIRPTKKRAFIAAARTTDLYRATIWHATSDMEAAEIRAVIGPRAEIRVAPNLPDARPDPGPLKPAKRPGSVRFCFFSRVSPKKGLREALQMLASVDGDVGLDVIGPVDDPAYWRACQAEMARLRPLIKVSYVGAVEPARVHETLAGYHFLILPTWNENFGHAIIDALAAGCPVIISDQTPWHQLEAQEAGWTIPLADRARFVAVMRECVAMDDELFTRRSRAAVAFAAQVATDPAALASNRALFMD